jgi:hypothetical protein
VVNTIKDTTDAESDPRLPPRHGSGFPENEEHLAYKHPDKEVRLRSTDGIICQTLDI